MGKKEITHLVISSLHEVIAELNDQIEISITSISESSSLIGRSALLDSLGLVTLIVNIEQRLNEEFGIEVTIVDEHALSQKRSPFRSVGSLSDYLYLLTEGYRVNG